MKTSLSTLYLSAAVAALVLTLTACEDPSNVGLGLVGEQGGRPATSEAAVTNLGPDDPERPANMPNRVLTGRVDDPLVGTVSSNGYLDFTPVSSSEFRAGTVQSAELRLSPTYVYGDTTAEITFALRSVSAEWEDEDLPFDTSFAVGDIILEFTYNPTDTVVVVPMPSDWVSENDALLRSEDFVDDFHGFRLDHIAGNAVVGFGPSSTSLFASTEDDSASFPPAKAYSALAKESTAATDDRLILQAGVGPEARFNLELSDEAESSAINRAAITFRADTMLTPEPNVHRPIMRTVDLYGITTEGGSVLLARSTLDDSGRFIFDSDLLAREIQASLLGTREYDHFALRTPTPATTPNDLSELALLPASISIVAIYDATAGELAPSAHLTLTPIDG